MPEVFKLVKLTFCYGCNFWLCLESFSETTDNRLSHCIMLHVHCEKNN